MFYVKSIDRYNLSCREYNRTGIVDPMPAYYLSWYEEGDRLQIQWTNAPRPMSREQLISVLMAIDHKEQIEITTGGYS